MDGQELLLGLCIGIGLAAATGFRVFVPLLVMSISVRAEYLEVASNLEWVGSMPALIAFGTATVMEVAAYYVPWVDNLLDSIATPAAIAAGTIATASVITDMDPLLQWAIGLIAGGGTAGAVQLLTVATRAGSTATTAGLGNPVVATAEAGAAGGLALVAVLLPVVAVIIVIMGLGAMLRLFLRWRARPAAAPPRSPFASRRV